jgi:hypothetical protein
MNISNNVSKIKRFCDGVGYRDLFGYVQISNNEPIRITKSTSCLYEQNDIDKFILAEQQGYTEKITLKNYTYGFDYMINTFLRSNEIRTAIKKGNNTNKPIDNLIDEFKKHESSVPSVRSLLLNDNNVIRDALCSMIDTIDSIFQRVTKLKVPVRLYRGQKEERITGDSYISTSRALDVAAMFSGDTCCIYVFDVQPGVAVLPLFDVSETPHEHEVLIERNCNIVKGETKELYIEYNYESVLVSGPRIEDLLKEDYWDDETGEMKRKTDEELKQAEEELNKIFKIVDSPVNTIGNNSTSTKKRRVKVHFYKINPPVVQTKPYCEKFTKANNSKANNSKANNSKMNNW